MATGVGPPNANRCRDERDEDSRQEQPPVRPSRVIRQPHRGGYDCEFIERPPKAVQCDCPVCLLVLREPYQVTCCGYSFCATCVKRMQEDKKYCPTCNEDNFNVYSNKGLQRTLNEYRVYCCQRGEGCDWAGELGELDRHLNLQPPPEKLLMGCQFSEVDCTYCIQPFQRRYVQVHQSDECPKRPYACQHCNKYTAMFEEVMQSHWPVCPFFPLSCPKNCELELQRQEVEQHVSRDCPNTLVLCDFHVVGCEIQLPRKDMPSHITEDLTGHMSLLQVHMSTHASEQNMATYLCLVVGSVQKVIIENVRLSSESLEQKRTVAQLEKMVTKYKQENVALQQSVTKQKLELTEMLAADEQKILATLATQQTTIAECRDESRKLQQSLTEQERKHEAKLMTAEDDLTHKIAASEQKLQATLATQQATIIKCRDENIRLQQSLTEQKRKQLENETKFVTLEERMCTGTLPFEFTMTHFEQHKRVNDEWYSPPFYTHTHGCRMCIRVNANGIGDGKGSHVSIFVFIMQGLFDDSLKWPFRGDVTIQIVNQAGEDKHHEVTIYYPDETPESIGGRTYGYAYNGWGLHQFLPHSSLGYNDAWNTQYLQENYL